MKLRKLWTGVLVALLAASTYTPLFAQVLHEQTQAQTVTKGVTLIKKEILTDNGWQDVHMLKVNIKDPYISLGPVESKVLGERKNVLDLAIGAGAIAAVNADFFDMQATSAPGFGAVIQDGALKHTYHYQYSQLGPAKNMATFLIHQDNGIAIDYFGMGMQLVVDGQVLTKLASYSTLPGSISTPILIDASYYATNEALLKKYTGVPVYTIVLEKNKVSSISSENEIVKLPAGAKAIVLNANTAGNVLEQLIPGDTITLEETIYLKDSVYEAVSNMQMGIGGGGIILRDGAAYQGASHQVSPTSRVARTIVATTQTDGEVLLITVDGKNGTLGANHNDLITLLQRLGAKDAMYLDGGGSTTMVARPVGESSLSLINKPADLVPRRVANGIGVFTSAPKGSLANLQMELTKERTFVGEGISVSVTGTDENSNPVSIEGTNVAYSVTGLEGKWDGKTFMPSAPGTGRIVAKVGSVETSQPVVVTKAPKGLLIEPTKLQIDEKSTKTVQIYGIDAAGYKIPLSSDKVVWTGGNGQVSAKGNTITAGEKTVTTFTANYLGATGNLGVVVGNSVVPIESFEENIGKWAGDTSTVKGKVEANTTIKYHGKQSLAMTYSFAKSTNKQVAYTVFDTPIVIPADASHINLWAKADGRGDVLKLQLVDAKEKTHYVKLSDGLKSTEWQYLTGALPEEVALPAKVVKLYTYANEVVEPRTSTLLVDHLSITRGPLKSEGISVRADYLYDSAYKPSLAASTGNQYDIKVVGPTLTNSMVLSEESKTKIGKKLSANSQLVLLASAKNAKLPLSVTNYAYNNAFQAVEHSNTSVLFIGTDAGGIRKTSAKQWNEAKTVIENTSSKHIILVMGNNPLTQFSDAREGLAFHKYLVEQRKQTGKNIFVVYSGGVQQEVRLEDGIRYIRLNGAVVPTDDMKQMRYLRFKIVGNEIYYTFEKVE